MENFEELKQIKTNEYLAIVDTLQNNTFTWDNEKQICKGVGIVENYPIIVFYFWDENLFSQVIVNIKIDGKNYQIDTHLDYLLQTIETVKRKIDNNEPLIEEPPLMSPDTPSTI